tara:strand:- start:2916 stop:3485 length:570 start_codon:yes stop_codon:yes gene_type:complete
MKKLKKNLLLIFCILTFLPYSNSMAYEEASYNVVYETDIYEIRYYEDRLVVEAVSKNDNNSFRKLFRYISGQNNKSQEIKMTVPVTQGENEEGYYMQFYLPSKFTKSNTPLPNNPDLRISTIEEGFFAVIRYSGRASDKNFFKHREILNKKLLDDNVVINGPAIRATYNGPFTLPNLRRNEVMYKVEWK